jgi:hypothetical protein
MGRTDGPQTDERDDVVKEERKLPVPAELKAASLRYVCASSFTTTWFRINS